MTDHVHLWDTAGICRGCGLDANRLTEALNQAYRERNELASAVTAMLPDAWSWKGVDPAEPDWPVLYMELPCGQISYHFSPSDAHLISRIRLGKGNNVWDGHTQEERSARLANLFRAWRTSNPTEALR